MAAKVTPYFILTAEGCSRTKSEDFINNNDIHQSFSKCSTMQNVPGKKLVTLTRNEVTRKRMDAIRQSLEDSRARLKSQIPNKDKSSGSVKSEPPMVNRSLTTISSGLPNNRTMDDDRKELLEIVPFQCIKKNDATPNLPYVYFVVSQKKKKEKECQTLLDENFFQEVKQNRDSVSRNSSMHRESERLKMKQIVNELGLKTDIMPNTLKQHHRCQTLPDRFMVNTYIRKPATTFAFMPDEETLLQSGNHKKKNSMDEQHPTLPRFDEDTISAQNSTSSKHFSSQLLELPEISFENQKRSAKSSAMSDSKTWESKSTPLRDSSPRRIVQFNINCDLPVIKGNGIPIVPSIPPVMVPRANTMPILSTHKEKDKVKEYVASVDRSRMSLVPVNLTGKRNNLPLNLPKIDIVSGVYDELIIKAITNYAKDFPTTSKQGKIARQLLQQLQERKISTNDITNIQFVNSNNPNRQNKIRIKEVSNAVTKSFQKENINEKGDKKPKELNSITPTCFKMAPPGVSPTGSVEKCNKDNKEK